MESPTAHSPTKVGETDLNSAIVACISQLRSAKYDIMAIPFLQKKVEKYEFTNGPGSAGEIFTIAFEKTKATPDEQAVLLANNKSSREIKSEPTRYESLIQTLNTEGFSREELKEFVPRNDYYIIKKAISEHNPSYEILKVYVRPADLEALYKFIKTSF
jgi:hypothetical protein